MSCDILYTVKEILLPKLKKGYLIMNSLHYEEERQYRENLIREIGYGKPIKTVRVDRGHPAGPEIHQLSDTGIITIFNERTHKLVTRLIARPGQIRRYYRNNEQVPQELINLARQHQILSYNCA